MGGDEVGVVGAVEPDHPPAVVVGSGVGDAAVHGDVGQVLRVRGTPGVAGGQVEVAAQVAPGVAEDPAGVAGGGVGPGLLVGLVLPRGGGVCGERGVDGVQDVGHCPSSLSTVAPQSGHSGRTSFMETRTPTAWAASAALISSWVASRSAFPQPLHPRLGRSMGASPTGPPWMTNSVAGFSSMLLMRSPGWWPGRGRACWSGAIRRTTGRRRRGAG